MLQENERFSNKFKNIHSRNRWYKHFLYKKISSPKCPNFKKNLFICVLVQVAQIDKDMQKSVAKTKDPWFKSYPQLKAVKPPKIELCTDLFTLSTKNKQFRRGKKGEKQNNCFVKML